jgi:hypothetical protein
MSRINAVRIINLNYNNNTMRIDDELFQLNGDSTLLSLRNGGGKTVLVQMMLAPFVTKRYRNLKDRSFSSYFTSTIPTYILVEWELDGAANKVLTGMMVRKRSYASDEDSKDDLEIVNFIHEYRGQNPNDIHNISLVETDEGRKKVKSFGNAKSLFESLKKNQECNFNYYDMTHYQQSKSYFEKLKEYQINHKEWESIIHKINLKESGLSELFVESKSAEGLIEKWFLKTVEDKLNIDEDKIENFRKIVFRYAKQYRENKSKIDKKASIEEFFVDGESIRSHADALQTCKNERSAFENRIANLVMTIDRKKAELDSLKENLREQTARIAEEMEDIRYEKLSLEIYRCQEEKERVEGTIARAQNDLDANGLLLQEQEQLRNILECAKLFEEYRNFSKEVQSLENELEILKSDTKDMSSERDNLGYTLGVHYGKEQEAARKNSAEIALAVEKLEDGIEKAETEVNSLNTDWNQAASALGRVDERIKGFEESEGRFNKRYDVRFMRNLTGYYDEGMLSGAELDYRKQWDAVSKRIAALNDLLHNKYEEKRSQERDEMDARTKQATDNEKLKNTIHMFQQFEQELSERKDTLKYIGFSEEQLFEKDSIVDAFDKRITATRKEQTKLHSQLEKEKAERNKLQTGKIAELPGDIAAEFRKRDILVTYGMEWLRKSENAKAAGEKLVRDNPFIPYSLIMNRRDIENLEKEPIESFTSYPIVILCREELDHAFASGEKKLLALGKVNFLISFNNKLIDKEELEIIVRKKKEDILGLEDRIQEKQNEIDFLEGKKNQVFSTRVDKESYSSAEADKKALEGEISYTDQKLSDLRTSISAITKECDSAAAELKLKRDEDGALRRRMDDLEEFRGEYAKYCGHLERQKQLKDEEAAILSQLDEQKNLKKALEADKGKQEERLRYLQNNELRIGEKLESYRAFKEGTLVEKDIEDIESRFESLSKKITDDVKNLEDRLEREQKRFESKENELTAKMKEYALEESQFKEVWHDLYKEQQTRREIVRLRKKTEEINAEITGYSKEIAVIETTIKGHFADLKKNHGKEDPKTRNEIKDYDFAETISVLEDRKKGIEQAASKLESQMKRISENRSALVEYDYFPVVSEVEIEVDYEELDRFRGEMLRDYKRSQSDENEKSIQLGREIERVLRKKVFNSDDFFRIPLETLNDLSNDPNALLGNLDIIFDSYRTLMEKLAADIELIQKEKENVLQSIFDYIREVHENLGKIDKNSSINIRGRSIKMLRIILPDWEENQALYKQRLNDLLDTVTARTLDRLDQNENAEETISAAITTKNLYNEVVTISSIEIKLFKIEEERERQITWNDVAKNSGGEGFLSAFVILSSLLSYMGRDETDIFAEKENSKVLVMDNPFAQTNADHLLKPLMEIAKKSNTQLVCLSGLGGDSIYNRFDNIYVLNLISSKLKGSVQFLRGEHLKGEETEEVMESSNFKITEEIDQMDLF